MKINLLKNKRVIFAVSLVLSFVLWLVVSVFLRPIGETVVSGVGVNVNAQSGILGELGLSVIEGAENTVNVTISGQRSVIGGISAEDISISPSLSGVTGAGTYTLELRASNNSSKEFEIVNISPASIAVKFDKYVDKTVKVEYVINGEYNIPDEYIQEEVYTDPKYITITGPERDISAIEKAVVKAELTGDYEETVYAEGDIILVDEEGSEVQYSENEITLSAYTAKIVVPVHRTVALPITFEYTNIPEFFDTANLKYTVSPEEIVAEGEDSIIEKFSDIFVGYVDMAEITLENPSVKFGVSLPEGLTVRDDVDEISIDFDLEDYVESQFNASQIRVINVPQNYSVTSNSSRVAVKLIGPKDVINEISAKDIVVQVDMSTREITQTGQYRIKAEVFLPGGENAWAVGDYSITVTVKEK
ncbi:MAG: hypothetical protein IJA92_06115 [Oscillospiraceae bacterium]|nr:hypothetical protein [Oscillospiraceae bacterium]